jgi:formylglycine-generating enzyme required for sulfatase activity
MEMVYVPAGEFIMGGDEFNLIIPIHTVELEGYWIDKTEVTNAMYEKCYLSRGCEMHRNNMSETRINYYNNLEYANYPVVFVTWNDAIAYCKWVNSQLPTEEEWEKAARGTDGRPYPWGEEEPTCSRGKFYTCTGDTAQVGVYPEGASPYGALDMAGNVVEWVNAWFDRYPGNNEIVTDFGTTYKVFRGGAFNFEGPSNKTYYRGGGFIDDDYYNILGFRCARND